MGSLYKRGNVWWIKYSGRNGKVFRESSKSTKKMVAKSLLDKREGEIIEGKTPGIFFEKVTFLELADIFLMDYRINQKKSLVRAERNTNHLKRFFEYDKAVDITSHRINLYIEMRLMEKAARATINRELSALKRMLNLGAQHEPPLVNRVPKIRMLQEDNVRTGFFEHSDFLRFREKLPEYLKGFVTFGYKYGWRFREISTLTWAQVDRTRWTIRLEVGTTKNKAGRIMFLDSELKEIFQKLWNQRKASAKLIPYVFPNSKGTGKIADFRNAWNNALKESKVQRKLFHDLRRTAVRNMVRAGIPEKVAMQISGHKTRSVFERYNIVDERDMELAATRQEVYLDSLVGTKSGTIDSPNEKKEFPKVG